MGISVTLFAIQKSQVDHVTSIERQLQMVGSLDCGKRLLHILNIDPETEEGYVGNFFNWTDNYQAQVRVLSTNLIVLAQYLRTCVHGEDQFGCAVAVEACDLFSQALQLVAGGDHFVALRWA